MPNAAASTASRPAFVTIAICPSLGDETARLIDLIWVERERKSFWKWDWTGGIRLIRFNKFGDASNPVARMERSEIRDRDVDGLAPDCASLHPGYALGLAVIARVSGATVPRPPEFCRVTPSRSPRRISRLR
jgi:hypothetical protein